MTIEEGQVAIVTGAASGIGKALSLALARRGLRVVLTDVEAAALGVATEEAEAIYPGASGIELDVSDPEAFARVSDRVIDEYGEYHVVCNNAGISLPFRPLWEATAAEWRWIEGVNLTGVVNGIATLVPHLVERGDGHVVNVASMAGATAIPYNGLYNATKHAVVSLSETLAAELEQRAPGVAVTIVYPTLTATNIGNSARNRPSTGPSAGPSRPSSIARPPAIADQGELVWMSADDVATATLAAMDARRLHLLLGPDARQRAEQWMDRLVVDLP